MTSSYNRRHWLVRYLFAVAAVAAGGLLRMALTEWVGPGLPAYITFYPAVMAAALFAGLGPGLVATMLAAVILNYWVLLPIGSGTRSTMDIVGLVLFCGMGAAISSVSEMFRRIRSRLAELVARRTQELREANIALQTLNADLERRVAANTADLHRVNETLELRISERTAEVVATNKDLRESQRAALNLMDDAVIARNQAEAVSQDLQRTARELARSNKDLEQFAHVTSHDLKEPLRMVTGFMSLLKDRYGNKLDAKAMEYIGFATEAGSRMQKMIDDLLAYAREGRNNVIEAANTENILDSALANLRSAIDESGAVIMRKPMPVVNGHASGLVHVFQNLIGNAIKFRRPDSQPQIHVAARAVTDLEQTRRDESRNTHSDFNANDINNHESSVSLLRTESTLAHAQATCWLFSVSDNGIGISPEFADKIFMIFQRLHTREEYQGNGVGLAICKKIVEQHGGRIWVESIPGSGSTFFFTLPQGKDITGR